MAKKSKEIKDLGALARAAANRYWRSTGRQVEKADLVQEAWRAILEAQRTFDASRGTPFHHYAWRAAVQHLNEVCWARKLVHVRRRGAGTNAAEVSKSIEIVYDGSTPPGELGLLSGLVAKTPPPETQIELDEFEESTQAAVAEALSQIDGGFQVLALLLRRRSAAEVAEELGRTVPQVYKLTGKVRCALRRNPALVKLWETC